jgi:hypothetical protein
VKGIIMLRHFDFGNAAFWAVFALAFVGKIACAIVIAFAVVECIYLHYSTTKGKQ